MIKKSMFLVLTLSLLPPSVKAVSIKGFLSISDTVCFDPFKTLTGVSEQNFFKTYGFSENGNRFLRKALDGKQGTFYYQKVTPFSAQQSLTPSTLPFTFSIIEG